MEIQPRERRLSPSGAGRGDQQAVLIRDLAPLAQIMGHEPAIKKIRADLLNVDVDPAHLIAVCRFVRDQLGFELLSCISGVDMVDHLEAVYQVRSFARRQILQFRVRLDSEKPEVESVVSVWPSANWHEREMYDLFGIWVRSHPDLRRILLDDDFVGHPLLKSFHQTPFSVKDQATTQVDPNLAVMDNFQTKHYEHVVMKKLGQGAEERLHPGTPTFGHTQENVQKQANQHLANPSGESPAGKEKPVLKEEEPSNRMP